MRNVVSQMLSRCCNNSCDLPTSASLSPYGLLSFPDLSIVRWFIRWRWGQGSFYQDLKCSAVETGASPCPPSLSKLFLRRPNLTLIVDREHFSLFFANYADFQVGSFGTFIALILADLARAAFDDTSCS